MKQRKLLKLSAELCLELEAEAERYRPRETGGILLGVTGPRKGEWEVTELIGAGPRAKRERHRFTPDGPWQRAEVAKRYTQSAGTLTYLGDWHSHPAGNGPSNLDHNTARHIAETSKARCPHPIFLIVTRSKNAWEMRAYRFSRHRLRRIRVAQSKRKDQARTDRRVS